jgi:hypothetical protein
MKKVIGVLLSAVFIMVVIAITFRVQRVKTLVVGA